MCTRNFHMQLAKLTHGLPVVCLYHVLKAVVLHQAELCWQLKLVHFHLHCKYAGEFWLHGCAFVLDGLMKVIKQKANMG